jgi:hypothetical protein
MRVLTKKAVAAQIMLLLLWAVSPARQAPAQLPSPSLTDVQSVYLFNFAKFVRWPAGAEHNSLTICIAGQKVYAETLIDGHALAVRTIQHPEEVNGCGILFIGTSARASMEGLLAAIEGKPVLSVSDSPGFLDHGGMIQFVTMDNRVRFSVNLAPVAKSGISLSSELLKVAVNVKASGGGAP